jgi:hypothetical protein
MPFVFWADLASTAALAACLARDAAAGWAVDDRSLALTALLPATA